MFLHYGRLNKCYYYWFSNSQSKKELFGYWNEQRETYCFPSHIFVFSTEITSKKEAKEFLKNKYPKLEPIYTIAYHEGRRWFGNKEGSRRYKK